MADRKHVTIQDIADQEDEHVYVLNKAPANFKTVAHVLIPYTSEQTGDQRCIELEMTTIPIDLTEWAPKSELMKNPELRRAAQKGIVEFVPTREAERMLNTEEALLEQDRLRTLRRRRDRLNDDPLGPSTNMSAEQQQQFNAAQQQLPQTAPGDYDSSTTGVSPIVAQAMENVDGTTEQNRLALLRNILPMMTDQDKKYIRSKTDDRAIRELIG